ncbi:MAG: hypothetical protein IJI41_01960 [Anaerolineaceae bacterium]|nr:hypothetical protein [Anaerolineaceae bacterium]
MNSAMMNLMYENAYMNLSNGVVNPLDKEVLSYAPLPESVIDPYITQEVDPLATMNLTNNSLRIWIEESKKTSYFTDHFVTLSRMIMNGVATMARGLVTLHMKGEDLDQAPLSIQDLISISSYQFRKSYIGVLQTVKSKPEVSERLLMNQLRWNNTLIKLFKTKEKLSKSSECRVQSEGLESSETEVQSADLEGSNINVQSSNLLSDEKALPESEVKSIAEPKVLEFDSEVSEVSELTELSELPALAAPGAYGAIQAYGPLKNQKSGTDGTVLPDALSDARIQDQGNEERRMKNEGDEEGKRKNEVQPVDLESSDSGIQEQESGSEAVGCEETKNTKENSSFFNHNSSLNEDPSFSPYNPSLPDHPPEFTRILYRVSCRSSGNKDGALEFTFDEIYQLLADPEFCRYEPQLAADLRKALGQQEL